MRISKSWIIAAKDIKTFLRKRYTVYSLVIFPLIIGIGLPLVLKLVIARQRAIVGRLPDLLNAFAFFEVVAAAVIPTILASYSLVGEKIEKSLEPLLATPITDRDLLLGKAIGAFVPCVIVLYIGSAVFMALSDLFTHGTLGYNNFPNATIGIILLIIPLMAILAVEWSVIVSARATDPRAAQLQGYLAVIPLAIIYVATEVGAVTLNTNTLWLIGGVIIILDIGLYFLSTRTFKREEILTKWT